MLYAFGGAFCEEAVLSEYFSYIPHHCLFQLHNKRAGAFYGGLFSSFFFSSILVGETAEEGLLLLLLLLPWLRRKGEGGVQEESRYWPRWPSLL
jgi:hypothetical protein